MEGVNKTILEWAGNVWKGTIQLDPENRWNSESYSEKAIVAGDQMKDSV